MGKHLERQSAGCYRQVGYRIREYISSRISTAQHNDAVPEEEYEYPCNDPCYCNAGQPVVDIPPCLFLITCAEVDAEVGCCAYPEQHAYACRKGDCRESDIRRSIAKHSDNMTNKNLVGDIICRTNQHTYHRRYRVSRDQRDQRR